MAKMIDLTTERDRVSHLVPVEGRGPVVPVRRGERTRYLRDGRWIPPWLVWLRGRRMWALALVGAVVAIWLLRLLGRAR